MGIAFTDVLIELSSPKAHLAFTMDPQAFLDARPLTDSERDALLSGSAGRLSQAQSTGTGQFDRKAEASALPHLVEVRTARPEIVAEPESSPASGCVDWVRRTFVDPDGRTDRLE